MMTRLISFLFLYLNISVCGVKAQPQLNQANPAPAILARIHKILIYGDAGDGLQNQRTVGELMFRRHQLNAYDFALSMGDNQYTDGEDVFNRIFETPYQKLIAAGIKFYQTIGNHDMDGDRYIAQLAYSKKVDAENKKTGGWVLPAEDYVIEKPNLRITVVNVVRMNAARYAFIEKQICSPGPGWNVLSMHYPIFSSGWHGDTVPLKKLLLPLLKKCPIDFVLAGHDHHAELFEPWNNIRFALSGNAHESRPPISTSELKTIYRSSHLGFVELELFNRSYCFKFINLVGKESPTGYSEKIFCANKA